MYSYQLDSPESSNTQGIDDVEVHQLQVGEEGVLCLISAFNEVEERKLLRSLDRVCDGECWGGKAVYSLPLFSFLHRDGNQLSHFDLFLPRPNEIMRNGQLSRRLEILAKESCNVWQ